MASSGPEPFRWLWMIAMTALGIFLIFSRGWLTPGAAFREARGHAALEAGRGVQGANLEPSMAGATAPDADQCIRSDLKPREWRLPRGGGRRGNQDCAAQGANLQSPRQGCLRRLQMSGMPPNLAAAARWRQTGVEQARARPGRLRVSAGRGLNIKKVACAAKD